MRRKLAFATALLFLAGLALPMASETKGKTHDVTTTVVAVDAAAKTITIKDDTGQDKTVPVMDGAVESLKKLKAGDKVVLTCKDNDKGEHEGVSAIKPAKA